MKHQASKSPSDQLLAAEWNAEHLLTEGLDADKPSSGLVARQLYWATDTKILYKATSATAWEEILRGEVVSRLAQLSEKNHGNLTGVTSDQHHSQDHASRHVDGGADEITSKLDFRAMNVYRARSTQTISYGTSSTTWVDVSGVSVQIYVPVAAIILVFANLNELDTTGAAGSLWQQLVRDATSLRVQRVRIELTDYVSGLIQTVDANAPFGTRTYKLQGKVESGMTGYWNAGQAVTEITAIAFPV